MIIDVSGNFYANLTLEQVRAVGGNYADTVRVLLEGTGIRVSDVQDEYDEFDYQGEYDGQD